MPEITETFFAESRAAWRSWLADNGAAKTEIWLVLNKKHVQEPSVTYDQAVEEALCYGWIDGIMKRIDDRQHTIRFTPRRLDSVWSVVNKDRVERMIEAGLMTDAGLALVDHAKQTGEWEKASGTLRDRPIPDEMEKYFEADPEAREWFEKLAPSHRRQYLGWIHEAKREETRQRRIAKALDMIAERKKPGM